MDQLQIINKALIKCGLPLAASIEDCDWNASYFFEMARDECLRSFAWGFAQKFVQLSSADLPEHGFSRSYAMPDDCLRVIDARCMHDLRSPKVRQVRVVGRHIYSNVSPFYLRYISSGIPIDEYPPDFCDVLACRLAQEIAALSAQSMALVPQRAQMYQLAMANAQATDARENFERVPLDWNILASRAGGGDGRGK